MISFDYTINFVQGSLNTDKYFNIYYDNKIIAKKVTLPYTISFNKWKSVYNIVIENDTCGSKKNIELLGQSTTTNFTTQPFPTTNPIFVAPITTIRPPETTLTTSTTTIRPKSIRIDALNVLKCQNVFDIILASTLIKFGGNYSGKLLIQITNFDTNFVFRKFDGGIVDKNEFSINLPVGNYTFEIKDALDESIHFMIADIIIDCPKPTFDVQYIPNTCGKNDSKIRIYNIKNADRFRYCFGDLFYCNNNFETPDGIVVNGSNEIIIELNSGKSIDYTHDDFIVIRGFNFVETDYTDVKIELLPCVKPISTDIIYVTSSYKDIKIDENGLNVKITISLLQNGRKYNAPTDISVSGYYTTLVNGSFILQPFDTIILNGTNSTSLYKSASNGTEIFEIYDTCISNIEPNIYLGQSFQNNSPCT